MKLLRNSIKIALILITPVFFQTHSYASLVNPICALLGFGTSKVEKITKTLVTEKSDSLYLREQKPQSSDENYVGVYLKNTRLSALAFLEWTQSKDKTHKSYIEILRRMHLTLANGGYTGRAERDDIRQISPGKFAYEVGAPRNRAEYYTPNILSILAKHNLDRSKIKSLNIAWPFEGKTRDIKDKVNLVATEFDFSESGEVILNIENNAYFVPRQTYSGELALQFSYIPLNRHHVSLETLSLMMSEIIERIDKKNTSKAEKQETVVLIAKYYHAAMSLHLFKSINQSLFFNQVIVLLMLAGQKPTPQGYWDHIAMVFDSNNFATIFADYVLSI